MLDSLVDWVGATAFWLSAGVVVGWQFPQPEWAKWVQEKLISSYEWAKAQFRG